MATNGGNHRGGERQRQRDRDRELSVPNFGEVVFPESSSILGGSVLANPNVSYKPLNHVDLLIN